MAKSVDIFIFIDALGWEIVKDKNFLDDLLPYRYPAAMQFGYSSTAIPTILTGQPPTVHKHLSFYYYAPEKSPFKIVNALMLKYLPKALDRWRVRHALSKIIAKFKGYTGYFEIYSMPFARMPYFDYIEKNDIFIPGGLGDTPNIADALVERRIPYHISNWRLSEQENIDALILDLEKGDIRFAFLYTARMDGLLHQVTKDGADVISKMDWYAKQIRHVAEIAKQHYPDFTLHVMSDHGMTTLMGTVDVRRDIERLGLRFGKDYAAVYDSTMARFWFLSENTREQIMAVLRATPHARILTLEDKTRYGVNFPDHMYGEEFLLMDPGWQIVPSDMGKNPLPGMHGFAPEHEDSFACFLSSEPIQSPPKWVGDFHRIMVEKMDQITPIPNTPKAIT